MHIWIDGDGCPVVNETVRLAREYGVPCTILCDTSHVFQRSGADTIVCDKGADSVDYKLVSLVRPGDLVVTQDYGLAAMCLSRRAVPLHQDGFVYSEENIGGLLEARAFSGKVRRAGGRLRGPKKRTRDQNRAFEETLRKILEEAAHAGGNS